MGGQTIQTAFVRFLKKFCGILHIFNDVRYAAMEDSAEMVDGVCGDPFSVFECIISRAWEPTLFKLIGADSFFFHGLE